MSRQAIGNAKRRRSAGRSSSTQSSHRDARGEIAYRAARLIAEEGTASFAAAKQKAARQMGLTGKGSLPDNEEIDAALRSHQSIFQNNSQPHECRVLRQVAVAGMRWLDRFSPWLVGAVLSGTANRFSQIELEIVAIDAKRLEMFFFNEGTPFETRTTRLPKSQWNNSGKDISIYEISFHDFPIVIAFYANHAVRVAHHPRKNIEHAGAQRLEVEALLAM